MQSSTSTSKAISMKRGRGQLRSTSKGNTTLNSNSKSESLEIEEISKKISEHADALYRTWKSRGLVPPTDLLELYTVEAAAVAAAGTSKEALQSTEGLQNLVNTFVIKDKEQRNNNNGANGKMAGNRIGIETIGAKKPTKLSNTSQISKFKATNVTEKITTATTTTATTITLLTPNENRKIIDNTSTNSFLKSFTQESLHNAHTAATNKISLANKSKSSAVMEKLNKTIDDKIVEKCDKLIDDHINKYSKIGKISAATSINNIKQNSTKLKTSNSNDKISDKMELIDDVITPDNAIIKTQSFISSIHAPLEKLLTTTTTTTTTKTKTDEAAMNAMNALEKNLNFDIDLDLKIDLNLNVQQLSQLQTQNLRKIKELLQDNNCKTPTRIPTPANSAFLTHAREKKPLKITTASTLPSTSSSLSLLPSSSSLLSSSSSSLLLVNDIKQQHQQAQQQQQQQWTTNENHQDDRKFAVMGRNGKTNELVVNGTVKSAHDSSKDRESNQTVGTKSLIRQPLQRVFEDNKNGNCNGINKSQEKFLVNTSVTNSNSSVTNSHLKTNANANANENMSTIDVEYTLQQKQQQHSNNQVIAPIVCSVQSDVTSVMTAFNTSHTAISSSDEIENPTIQITAVPATTTIKTTIATINNKNKMSKRTKVTNKIKDHKLKDNSIKIQQQAETSSIITQNKEELPIDSDTLLPLSLSTSLSSSSISSLSPISTQLSLSPVTSSSSDPTIVSLPNNVETAHKSNNGSDSTNNSCVTAANPMPTPMKLKSQRNQLGNGQEKNLRSNFLTRGSVAERVLMFEKCPDVRHAFLNIKRPDCVEPPKPQIKVKLHSTPPQPPKDHTSLQREYKALKSVYIPRFYFPHGKPQPQIAVERTLRGILSAFDTFPNNQVTKDELPRILKICGLPFYWRTPVLIFCQQGNNNGMVERQRFVEFWKQMNVYCHEEASRFVYILSRGQRFRNYILPEDLVPLVQDVVDIHPGLAFLKEATEFHSRYVHTVIARIFYTVNRSWSGKISISELKKSDLLEILCLLEEEDDINQIMAFFSYEHFYVIYCKFWELDKDHDLLINQDDLARHSDHALSTRIIERIFSGCVTRNDNRKNPKDEPKMSYTDFVWFLLSEEDKRTPTAIEYWFRCMDLDGDGVLSMYELEYFYEEQQQRMESIGIESLPFEDCLCQMLDMIKPQKRDAITLGDLKRCKMTHVFFDTFFNLEKYLDHEQRDPFATQRDEYGSDWDRFAAQEYELLITEEND